MEPLQLRGLQPATLQVPWRLPRGQMNKRRLEISTRLGGTVTVGRTAGTHPALGLPGAASLCGSRAGSRLPRAARGGRSALSKPAPRPASDPHVCGRNSRSNRRRGQSGPFVGVFWRALLSAWATPLSRDTSTVPPSGEAPKSKTNGETKGHRSRLPDPAPPPPPRLHAGCSGNAPEAHAGGPRAGAREDAKFLRRRFRAHTEGLPLMALDPPPRDRRAPDPGIRAAASSLAEPRSPGSGSKPSGNLQRLLNFIVSVFQAKLDPKQ